ncbi:MAG: response regulator [Flavobacteriaceae bacterium]|nr:response regulator [Flavobacteriaceae bacterium]
MEDDIAKVLIVDDEKDIVFLLELEFDEYNYVVEKAHSGKSALELIHKNKYDVILSDYRMPDGDGRFLLENVMEIPVEERPLFFFMSGQADISEDEALKKGAARFFKKPFDTEYLIQKITKILKESKER